MELFVGKQLFTRDGRKVGNAIVTRQIVDNWELETDFGNTMVFNAAEIVEFYQELDEDSGKLVSNDLNDWRGNRMMNILKQPGFKWINKSVEVRGEDFSYVATCLCSFPKTNGKVRYIVEDNGRLFIQREEQLDFLMEPEEFEFKEQTIGEALELHYEKNKNNDDPLGR